MRKILVTGGAGFVGSALALAFKAGGENVSVTALDNLRRRGSELNLPRLAAGGVSFVHGDVRSPGDLEACGPVDLVVECSAEPSVLAGYDGSPDYVLDTNLTGAVRCLEHARRHGAAMVFLSTSRVYPVARLNQISLSEGETRFEAAAEQALPGVSPDGVTTAFPLDGPRSLYGATKLCAELLIAEYADMYGLPAVVNRCGVIAGHEGRILIAALPFWDRLHQNLIVRAALAGANAAVVGILAAALWTPVITSGVTGVAPLCIAATCFLLLTVWKLPAWVAVLLGIVAGVTVAVTGVSLDWA